MRFITTLAACLWTALFFCGCAGSKSTATRPDNINGTWIPVRQEMAGNPMPQVIYASQKLVIADTSYTLTAESVDKGGLRYGYGKMDIYGRSGVNAGKHFTAIYKLDQGQLFICYNLRGDSYPDQYETKGKQLWFLSVFKKVSSR